MIRIWDFLGIKIIVALYNRTTILSYHYEIDEIKIYNGKDVHIFSNVTLMVVKTAGDGYDLILHPALIKESYEDYSKIKKVS